MNYTTPFGSMPNQFNMPGDNMMPMYPEEGMPSAGTDKFNLLEQKINNMEKRLEQIEKKLNMDSNNGFFPYQSSMHMM